MTFCKTDQSPCEYIEEIDHEQYNIDYEDDEVETRAIAKTALTEA